MALYKCIYYYYYYILSQGHVNLCIVQVTDFEWSHDGQMALICYKDSFVLVGSVAGQRYWSSMLNLEGCLVTCGIWTPDDQKVYISCP